MNKNDVLLMLALHFLRTSWNSNSVRPLCYRFVPIVIDIGLEFVTYGIGVTLHGYGAAQLYLRTCTGLVSGRRYHTARRLNQSRY